MLAIGDKFFAEYDILHFSKRAYTDKFPKIAIPSNMSRPAIKNVIGHLQNILSQTDKEADKFDGTKSDYDEKTNIAGQ